MHWNTASVKTTAQYKAFMNKDLTAKVVVNIGLRGFDVSLKGVVVFFNSLTILSYSILTL